MHKVKQGIKQAANKKRRKMSKDAVDEMDKEDYMSKKKQLQRIQMDPNTHKDEKLKKELMVMIVERLIKETNELLVENESSNSIEVTENAKNQLAEDGFKPTMGARPLKRLFEDKVKKPLSKKILFEDIKDKTITIDYNNDEFTITLV